MLKKILQLVLFLRCIVDTLTESIYIDATKSMTGNGSSNAPFITIEEGVKSFRDSGNTSGTIIIVSNQKAYRFVSAWNISQSLTVKFQGSSDSDLAVIIFEDNGRLQFNGEGVCAVFERVSFNQVANSLKSSELVVLDSGASLGLEKCVISNVDSPNLKFFIHALKANEISFSNSEISSLKASVWTHIIYAEGVNKVYFTTANIKDNVLNDQVLLETIQKSDVEFTGCIIENNVLSGVSKDKSGFMFKMISNVKITDTAIQRNLLNNATLFNITANSSLSNTLDIIRSNFYKNTATESLTLLMIASNTNLKISLITVKLQNNFAVGSLMEFFDTLATASLVGVTLINNMGTQAISLSLVTTISVKEFTCTDSNKDLNQFAFSPKANNMNPGPCLLIYDYRSLTIAKMSISSNLALSSITGLALLHTTKTESSSSTGIPLTAILDGFLCEDNYVMSNNTLTFSGNCLYISIQGNITINNSNFKNNKMENLNGSAYGGNPCLSSDGLTAQMTVRNSNFSGNKAYSECMCFKFDGFLIDIQDTVFGFNTGIGSDNYFGAEGGSLYLGADIMVLTNITLQNSSSAKGAGIFFHNKFQKKYQSLTALNVRIVYNSGIQTSGLDFDASLLTGKFNFTNCSVSDNSVEFYGVISTFYFTEIIIHFIRCRFERNLGLSAGGAMSFYHFGGLVYINNSIFYKNTLTKNVFVGGSAIFLYGTTYLCLVYVRDSWFEENHSDLKGGAIATMFGTLHCFNCTFKENYAKYGGAVNLAVYCPGTYTNSRFISKQKSIYGGGIFTADEAVLTITNTTFEGLSAEFGGAIKMDGLLLTLIMSNVSFLGNSADRGGALDFSNTLKIFINITNATFENNVCKDSILNLGNLALSVTNMVFKNNSGRIFQMKTVIVIIYGLKIDNHICIGADLIGCGGYLQEATAATIQNSIISNIQSTFLQDFISLSDSDLIMNNSSLKNITSTSKSIFLFARTSDASLSNIFIDGLDGEIINFEEGNLEIYRLQALRLINSKSEFGTVYCAACSLLRVKESLFSQIQGAKFGGALHVTSATGEIFISSSNFSKCSSSGFGGSIYVKQSNITIVNSSFTNNIAEENGGAAYFECDNSIACEWKLNANTFENNSAKISGGAYHSVSYIPLNRSTNSFLNNKASYGPDYSSFPVRLTLEAKGDINYQNKTESKMIPLNCEMNPDDCVIRSVASGQILPWISFAIIDTYGQKMILEEGLAFFDFSKEGDYEAKNQLHTEGNNSLAMQIQNFSLPTDALNISFQTMDPVNKSLSKANDVLVKGVKTVQSKEGSFNFSEIQILGEPNTVTEIKIKSDLIPHYDSIYISKTNDFDEAELSTKEYAFTLKAYLRDCIRGEIKRKVQEQTICYKCPKNQYSLDIADQECSLCPQHSSCEGGDRIIVEKGFWRSSTNSTRIYACNPMSDPCLGGYENNCINGHTGNLCGNCIFSGDNKWFKKGIYFCEKCGNLYIYIIVLVIGIIVIFGFIIYLIWSRKNQDTESYLLVKMITTHIQTISFVSNIKITLPTALSSMNSVQAPATSTESFVFAFECFKDKFTASVYAIKLVSSVMILLLVTLIVNIYYISIGIYKKEGKKKIFENLVNALVIIYSFLQPSFINYYIQNLSCDEIDGKQYLTFNLDEECWNGTHYALSVLITLPMLLFWMLIFPGLFFHYMFKNRSKLKEEFVYQITRFFQVGFKQKYYFWEFLNMLRKFLIILLTTFLRNNQQVVIYILIPVMASFFFLQNYARPFEFPRHNRLEIISLNAAFLTYYSAVFYIRSITDEAKIFFLAVILISNIVYFVYWLRQYIAVVRRKVKGMVSSIKNAARKITEIHSPSNKRNKSVSAKSPKGAGGKTPKTMKSIGDDGSKVENIVD